MNEQAQQLQVEQQAPRVAYAGLCRAALDPEKYNNTAFWNEIYKLHLQDATIKTLDALSFLNESKRPSYSDGHTDYFTCWPDIHVLFKSLTVLFPDPNKLVSIFKKCGVQKSLLMDDKQMTSSKHSDNSDTTPLSPTHNPSNGHNKPIPGYFGKDYFKVENSIKSCASIQLRVLAGMIATLGAVAVTLAFAVLNAPMLGLLGTTMAVVGAVGLFGGFGLFKSAPADNIPILSMNSAKSA